jgi:hypothetical protein
MRRELQLPDLEDGRERDEQGRFRQRNAVDDFNARIRAFAGR